MSIRKIRDASFATSLTLPAAAANADSDSIDLEAVAPGATVESVELEIAIPALSNLADSKKMTVKVQDSDDDSSFTDVAELPVVAVTGGGGTGSDAKTVALKLPSDIGRYVRINAAVASAGGDNTGDEVTFDLLF